MGRGGKETTVRMKILEYLKKRAPMYCTPVEISEKLRAFHNTYYDDALIMIASDCYSKTGGLDVTRGPET